MQLPVMVNAITEGAENREEAARASRDLNKQKCATSVAVAPRQKSERAAGRIATRRIRAQVKGPHAAVSDNDEDEYSIGTGGKNVFLHV